MNYPNKQSRKRFYILLYDLAEKLQKLRSGISMLGEKLEELKSLGPLGLGPSGQFGQKMCFSNDVSGDFCENVFGVKISLKSNDFLH